MVMLAALLFLLPAPAPGTAELPKEFTVPAEFREDVARRRYWQFDTSQFDFLPANAKNTTHEKVEGHLWRTALSLASGNKNDGDGAIELLAAHFEKNGWTILRRQGAFVARKSGASGDFWMSGSGNPGDFRLVIVETAPPPRVLSMPPPQREIETFADDRDFPYAPPFPGSTLQKTVHDRRPFEILLPDSKQSSYATPFATRWYAEPRDVSSYEFVAVYRKAFEGAGWNVARAAVAGDAVVLAHYTKNGRDLWLYTRADGGQQSISVADFGADAEVSKLKQELGASGHVALYGIYFDTDSSVPRPESEATLLQVLQLLKSDPSLRLEVQGHTDDTGSAEHNASLSDARAASVRKWLTDREIAAARLTSKGYGSTKPVADNHTPEGRAKNRRVELAKP